MDRAQILNRIANLGLTLVLVYAAVTLAWRWLSTDARQGRPAPAVEAVSLEGTVATIPPSDDKPLALVYWATWCGPCRIELGRVQSAIDAGEIPADRVFAISSGESLETVRIFAREHHYTFRVFADENGTSASLYGARVTPTMFHISGDRRISWVAEGLHPLSVRRTRTLLED
jgi:cytochrome c biogenesis protein CcmG/thiol:disulfide interchange protein DsbE